uniref:Very-long-chain 3-oxoacyl-CoA synthase n=1 Tax=Globodera pallida TaxID=36090 RepID=A0A183C5N7_GLOPA
MPVPNAYISWLAKNNLLLQWFYYTTAAILMPSPYRSRTFASELHTVTAAIVFPFSLVVVMLIWALYLMDPGTQAGREERILFAENWNQIAVVPLFAMLIDIFILYGIIVVRYNLWTYPIFRKVHVGCRPILPMLCFYLAFVGIYPIYYGLREFRFMRFVDDRLLLITVLPILQHWYRHVTTLNYGLIVYVVMYTYYLAACRIRLPAWFAQCLTTLQISQFLIPCRLAPFGRIACGHQ